MERVALRPANDGDRAFLAQVYASTRADELALLPWTDEQKAAFVAHQFEAQDTHYRAHYDGAAFDVIEVGGVPAGRLYVHRGPATSASSTSRSHRRSADAGSALACCGP